MRWLLVAEPDCRLVTLLPGDLPGLFKAATPWRDSWSPAQLRSSLQAGHPGVTLVCGRVSVAYCVYRLLDDVMEILNLAVFFDHRSRGYGRKLMQLLEELAKNKGCGALWLEVRASNEHALSLYRARGFGTSGRREGYYLADDGTRMDALLMEKRLDES